MNDCIIAWGSAFIIELLATRNALLISHEAWFYSFAFTNPVSLIYNRILFFKLHFWPFLQDLLQMVQKVHLRIFSMQ